MNIHLVTFSNYKYKQQQINLNAFAKSLNLNTFEYNFDNIKETNFYSENKKILDREKGCGFCLWKPYIIKETLKLINKNDIVFYIDCADVFHEKALSLIQEEMKDNAHLFLFGGYVNKLYTKRDTFFYMNCDEPVYWNSIQCEAGINCFKNNNESEDFLSEWLNFCKDERIITSDENKCGLPNFPEYIDHRYDQSVLSNLIIKHNKKYFSSRMRNFVTCNVND